MLISLWNLSRNRELLIFQSNLKTRNINLVPRDFCEILLDIEPSLSTCSSRIYFMLKWEMLFILIFRIWRFTYTEESMNMQSLDCNMHGSTSKPWISHINKRSSSILFVCFFHSAGTILTVSHNIDITERSRRIKSAATWPCVQQFIQADIKSIKPLNHLPIWEESTGGQWIPQTKGQ